MTIKPPLWLRRAVPAQPRMAQYDHRSASGWPLPKRYSARRSDPRRPAVRGRCDEWPVEQLSVGGGGLLAKAKRCPCHTDHVNRVVVRSQQHRAALVLRAVQPLRAVTADAQLHRAPHLWLRSPAQPPSVQAVFEATSLRCRRLRVALATRPVTDIGAPRSPSNGCFYEDSFVKPLLIAAFMGGTSWAPHEGMWGTWHGATRCQRCILIRGRGVTSVRASARTNFYPCRTCRSGTRCSMRARRLDKPQLPTRPFFEDGPHVGTRSRCGRVDL